MKSSEINILKHMIFFIFFIVTSLALFFMLVIPQYKNLKKSNIKNQKSSKELKLIEKQEKKYILLHKDTLSSKLNIVNAFDSVYDKDILLKDLEKEMIEPKITQINQVIYNEIFNKKTLNIKAKIKSPLSLYKYFESLDKSKYITEINYPINFRKVGDLIAVEFNLSIYYNRQKQ